MNRRDQSLQEAKEILEGWEEWQEDGTTRKQGNNGSPSETGLINVEPLTVKGAKNFALLWVWFDLHPSVGWKLDLQVW